MENKKINFIVGFKIKEKRKVAGMSGRQLSLSLGISQQQFSRYECGLTPVRVDMLYLIAQIIDVPIVDLLPDDI